MFPHLTNMLRSRQWGQAFFELAIVALGILMAFQVDRWREESNDREMEQQYLARLSDDINQDIRDISAGIELAELRLEFARLLMDAAEDQNVAIRSPVDFILAVDQSSYTFTPALTSNTFDELRSTGNIGLLRNTELKNGLFGYYRYDETERQYMFLQHMQEIRHFEYGRGIISNQQLRKAQTDWGIVNKTELAALQNEAVDPNEITAAVERLRENPAFIAWLPLTHEMQLELLEANGERLRLATELQEILHTLQNPERR